MSNKKNIEIMICLLLIAYPQIIFGDGTKSGVIVSNSTTINYQVSTVPQVELFSNSGTFVVDNKDDLIVTIIDMNSIPAIIGSNTRVPTYQVTNKGNTLQDYSLKAVGLARSFLDVTDDINPNADGAGTFSSNDEPVPHDNIRCVQCHYPNSVSLNDYPDEVCYWCHPSGSFGYSHPLSETVTCMSCHYIHKKDKPEDVLCNECHSR